MKNIKWIVLIFLSAIISSTSVMGQAANATIQVLPANSGQVAVNDFLDLRIDIGNTGPDGYGAARLRPLVTVPGSVTFIASILQPPLPLGWTILSNTGAQLRLCNTADPLGVNQNRTITLRVQAGNTTTPPQTFQGQMNFGNGTTCANFAAVPGGNNIVDDIATSTIQVVAAPLPLTLLSFEGTLKNCEPMLDWVTESEINTDYFEIQKNEASSNNNWVPIGQADAKGTGSTKSYYKYVDKRLGTSRDVALYRLKIIDKDGAFKYSDAIKVNLSCSTKNISIFPNPVENGKLNVNINGYGNNVTAVLINSTGQSIKQFILSNGNNQLNVPEIPSGIYVLKIGDDVKTSSTVKIFINR